MYAFAYSIVENVTVYFERFDGVAMRHMHTVKKMDATLFRWWRSQSGA